jgi:outer membrane murein-binding lipoprotein Lpp
VTSPEELVESGRATPPPASIDELRAEVAELRAEVTRLDADLDESRRLNLRAAELLDLVYERLGRPDEP